MTNASSNVIKFPTRGKLENCPLAIKVSSQSLEEVIAYAAQSVDTPRRLPGKLKAILATAENGKCLLDFDEVLELRELGFLR